MPGRVGPRLRPGSIVVFDEFFNYPGWQGHECHVWRECLAAITIHGEDVADTDTDNQVTVCITEG